MKKIALAAAVLTIFAFASCGGGGDSQPSPTPSPTSTSTKVVTGAVVEAVNNALFQTIVSLLEGSGPGAMVIKGAAGKAPFEENFTYTYNCPVSGTTLAQGSVSGNFSETDGSWSMTDTNLAMSLEFQNCTVNVTQDSTVYEEAVTGPGGATASGSASGSGDSVTNLNFTGNGTGTVAVTGDISGTAVLDITAVVTGVPDPMPDVACSGTVNVTSDATTQVCTVSSDCEGCVL
jgi:hypothetical protein